METISFFTKRKKSDSICNHMSYADGNTWKSTALILSSLCPHHHPLSIPEKNHTISKWKQEHVLGLSPTLSPSVYWIITSDDVHARYTKNTSGHPHKPNHSTYENKIFLDRLHEKKNLFSQCSWRGNKYDKKKWLYIIFPVKMLKN